MKKYIQITIYYSVTICAIIIGTVQYMISAFNNNNGAEKVRNIIKTILVFMNTIIAQVLTNFDTDVPPVEVAQMPLKKTRKRATM